MVVTHTTHSLLMEAEFMRLYVYELRTLPSTLNFEPFGSNISHLPAPTTVTPTVFPASVASPILDISCKQNLTCGASCLTSVIENSVLKTHLATTYWFPILYHDWAIVICVDGLHLVYCLLANDLANFWVVPTFRLEWVKLLWMFVCKLLMGHHFPF